MAQKYKRILQAAKYYSAIDNYIKYVTDSTKRGSKVGSGTARDASQLIYLRPFGLSLNGSSVFAKARVTVPTWDMYKARTEVTSRGKLTLTSTEDGIKVDKFVSAAAIIVAGKLPKGVSETSKVTGMKYLKYGGRSRTLPFGKGSSASESESDAFNSVRQGIIGATNNVVISHRREQV